MTAASLSRSPVRITLGLDMGGTHTDAVLMEGGHLTAAVKVPTDHGDLFASVRNALQKLFAGSSVPPSAVTRATFGTTLAVNAVVQHACAPVGLFLSAGPGLDPAWFALGQHTAIIPGGLDHRGVEVAPLDEAEVHRIVSLWREMGITSFACVSRFSTRNPDHEDRIEAIIRGLYAPQKVVISTGHSLSGRLNFPRRIATAYWNAAVWELHGRFADAVEAGLQDMGIHAPAYLLKADGGALSLAASRLTPVEALRSGPAASVMGILALIQTDMATKEDILVLDMGGTTTDIALLARGQPLLAPRDLVIDGRSTLVRALHSLSIGLGGDSLISVTNGQVDVGPQRIGPAVAFGGTQPTFLDALNLLGYAHAGDCSASADRLEQLAANTGFAPADLARIVLEQARTRIAAAVQALLNDVNNQPVYTLAALLENRRFRPSRAVLVGGPAQVVAPLLGKTLNMPVSALADPQLGPVANAIGAALVRTTASLDLFADTAAGVLLVPGLGIKRAVTRRYSLSDAKAEACDLLRSHALAVSPDTTEEPLVDVVDAQEFATLDAWGRGGRDIRVRCQLRPGCTEHFI